MKNLFDNISAVLKDIFMYRFQFLNFILKPATFVTFYVVKTLNNTFNFANISIEIYIYCWIRNFYLDE